MEKTPRNKMINTEDENTKKVLGKKVIRFYFPHLQKTVFAENFEEAEKIINNNKQEK